VAQNGERPEMKQRMTDAQRTQLNTFISTYAALDAKANSLPSSLELCPKQNHLDNVLQIDRLYPFMIVEDFPEGEISILDRRNHTIIEAGHPLFDVALKIGLKHREATYWLKTAERIHLDAENKRETDALIQKLQDNMKELGYDLVDGEYVANPEKLGELVETLQALDSSWRKQGGRHPIDGNNAPLRDSNGKVIPEKIPTEKLSHAVKTSNPNQTTENLFAPWRKEKNKK
jgi:hypothetical protein